MSLDCIDLKISDTVMTSQERNKFRARTSKRTQSFKHSFKKVCISCAAHTLQHTCKRKAHASYFELLHTHIYHRC
jgi:hypothetical protein